MSTQLVRFFTCASIISLGGLAAAITTVACSSSSSAAPAEGDDDTKGDDDDTTTTTKDAGSSSSSGGTVDAGAKRPDYCTDAKIAGTYTFGKSTSKVTTAGAVCDAYAKASNDNGGPIGDVTYTKSGDGQFTMTVAGNADYKLELVLADDRCQLAGAEQAYQQQTKDADGKTINVAIGQNHIIDIPQTGDIKDTVSIFVQSDPAGAPGTPCVIQSTTTGTKK